MIPFPCFWHSPDDDLAPVDYSYVRSVGEGRRRAQLQNIHPEPAPEAPILRTPQKVDEYGIPENPFAPQTDPQPSVRRSRAARSAPQPVSQPAQPSFAPQRPSAPAHGPQFDAPASPEIPDWLRVAQQNNFPLQNRPQGPRVQAAPRHDQPNGQSRPMRRPVQQQAASPYEAAGYPQHLLDAQRQLEREQAAQPVRRRHGAQYAQRPQYEPQPAPEPTGMSYPPPRTQQEEAPAPMARAYMHQPRLQPQEDWQVETDEEEVARELPLWVRRMPWLGIAAFAAVMAAVILWIVGMSYDIQTRQVLDERAAQEARIVENHPLKYEELIAEKAEKYNISPAFIAAIMLNESSFRPDATAATTGARGLMQLMNDTAGWIHGKMDMAQPYSFDMMYDAETNAEFGCWYLNYLSGLFHGDPVLVAAAFHAGQGEVRNWLNTAAYSPDGRTVAIDKIPIRETRQYVGRVMNAYAAYLRIYYGG